MTKIWVLVLLIFNSAITRISPVAIGDEVYSRIQGFSKCTHGGDSNDDSGSASQRPSTYVYDDPSWHQPVLSSSEILVVVSKVLVTMSFTTPSRCSDPTAYIVNITTKQVTTVPVKINRNHEVGNKSDAWSPIKKHGPERRVVLKKGAEVLCLLRQKPKSLPDDLLWIGGKVDIIKSWLS